MGFQTTIKLGRPRNELSFVASVSFPEAISFNIPQISNVAKNVFGQTYFRVRRRINPSFSVSARSMSESIVQQIESLRNISDTLLSFYWADARNMYSDRYLLDTTTTLKLSTNPMTDLGKTYKDLGGTNSDIITVVGVFTTTDPGGAQGGTNYFSGGGLYTATDRKITLGSSPGAAGTAVYVNWRFNGAHVLMGQLKIKHSGGDVDGSPLYDVDIPLEGG